MTNEDLVVWCSQLIEWVMLHPDDLHDAAETVDFLFELRGIIDAEGS